MTKTQLKTYHKLFQWLVLKSNNYWKQMFLNIMLGGSYVVSSLTFVWITKRSIDIATGVRHGNINYSIIGLLVVLIVQISISFSMKWIRAVLGIKARNRMQESVFNHLLTSEWISVRQYHTGDMSNRIMEDANVVVNLLTEQIPQIVSTIFQLAGAFCFLYLMDRRLALIVLFIAPTFILFSKLFFRKMRRISHDVRAMESDVQSCIQESLQNNLVVKTLERVDFVTDRLAQNHLLLRKKVVERTWYGSISQMIMSTGFALGYFLTFVWGIRSLNAGIITYGALTAFIQLVGQIQSPIQRLTSFVPVFISAFTASERLIELEEIPAEQHASSVPQESLTDLTLRYENVSYAYDGIGRSVIQNFSYSFPSGSVTAIVGETGAGKTTLIRLLLSLIQPTEGRLTIGEEAITAAHRRFLTYVPQGNTLLSGTIRDNLRLGRPDATDDEMWEVLGVASADFVRQLPEGLGTICSERGGGLSEGQAQRICIARALLRNAPIMLFDESTSALDETTERTVVERIMQFAKGATLIFVTHRPEVLKHCDQVLHLERNNSGH